MLQLRVMGELSGIARAGGLRFPGFVAALRGPAYIGAMVSHRQPVEFARRADAIRPLRRVVLADHARLPWRFFGRLTAAIQTGL
jgi:hypothetical protein